MKSGETENNHNYTMGLILLMIVLIFFTSFVSHANTVGRPPITEIEIPSEPYVTIFDMVQDHNNVIYLSYDNGLKIFDGNHWQNLLIPDTYLTRILYFDENDLRVYVGGFDFFGYVIRNRFGEYEFIDITPKENPIQFASIWEIIGCDNQIFFRALNHVFALDPTTGNINSWTFNNRLGDILCFQNRVILQDRVEGMKELKEHHWIESQIQIQDNSLIYDLEVLDNQQIFIRSLSNNWRIIEDNEIKPIAFKADLPELGSFADSETLDDNKVLMGGKDGSLTFLDFNTYQSESFQISSNWISAITEANDGGILVLSNFNIYHLTWPSPWRIQDYKTGLSSDIFDMATWNGQLYVTSRSGVFVEQSQQSQSLSSKFQNLKWTAQEAWNLMPINENEILLADSHYISIINNNEKTIISDVIYPRIFQQSKFHEDLIITRTELDTRILFNDENGWSNWVVLEGKPNGVAELSADTLLISTTEGRLVKVIYDQEQQKIETSLDLTHQNSLPSKIDEMQLFNGPNDEVFAANSDNYYQWENNTLIESDLLGLSNLLPPQYISKVGLIDNGTFWAISATKAYIMKAPNDWTVIDATPYVQGGLYDLEFSENQIKLSANSVILSYLITETENHMPSNGKLMITSAKLNKEHTNDFLALPIDNQQPLVIGPKIGSLTIQYSFTDIKSSDDTTYQFRLKGHNNQWSPLSQNTEASFLELPAGDFKFEVKAVDVNGNPHSGESLIFTVEPVWYLKTWALLLWVLCSLLLLFLTLKLYLRWRERKHEFQKQALKEVINEKTQALKLANQALQDLAHKDSLTGLSNRLYLDKYIDKLIENGVSKMAVLMMDMDHFKKYNDTYGHLAGDQLLEKFSESLLSRIKRKQDLIVRYGGEEFLVIMPETNQKYALEMAESIRKHTAQQKEKTTISVGVVLSSNDTSIKSSQDVFNLIDQADKALYEAKTTGRNQVILFDETLVS